MAPAGADPAALGYRELAYRETDDGALGVLSFEFYNGAMSTAQCRRLLAAIEFARGRPTHVLVLDGGAGFWSNGIHLNTIEAAPSPGDESWANIEAIDDVCLALLGLTDRLTVAALRGNAGAGGCFLALACDRVWAREDVVMNPHYKNMGNLFGSEYWTYLLPRRVGEDAARAIMRNRLPLLAREAAAQGLIDDCFGADRAGFAAEVEAPLLQLRRGPGARRAHRRQGPPPRRRRGREAARRVSRRRARHDAAQFLRFRPELPCGALPLRAEEPAILDAAPPRPPPRAGLAGARRIRRLRETPPPCPPPACPPSSSSTTSCARRAPCAAPSTRSSRCSPPRRRPRRWRSSRASGSRSCSPTSACRAPRA